MPGMVARPGLPDKRGSGPLFRLAGRPDSDNDRRVLSLTTSLALQIVRLGATPNWRLRGEGRNGFTGVLLAHLNCLLGVQVLVSDVTVFLSPVLRALECQCGSKKDLRPLILSEPSRERRRPSRFETP